MAKKNKQKTSDEETLKHYTSYNEEDVPAGLPKPDSNSKQNKPPEYIKADISVDKIMSQRKNAVIKPPSPETNLDD